MDFHPQATGGPARREHCRRCCWSWSRSFGREASRPAPVIKRCTALLFRPLVGELLLNTLGLIAATTFVTAIVATAAAWCVERTDLPGRRLWAVLVAVPLAIPAFITSFAWVSMSPALQDFGGALLVVSARISR